MSADREDFLDSIDPYHRAIEEALAALGVEPASEPTLAQLKAQREASAAELLRRKQEVWEVIASNVAGVFLPDEDYIADLLWQLAEARWWAEHYRSEFAAADQELVNEYGGEPETLTVFPWERVQP